jgi:hypothetical protein
MNDIYLYRPPENFVMIKEILEAGGIQLHSRDVELQGYLGLNLEFEDVTATLYLLQKAGATGEVVPVIYRDSEREVLRNLFCGKKPANVTPITILTRLI